MLLLRTEHSVNRSGSTSEHEANIRTPAVASHRLKEGDSTWSIRSRRCSPRRISPSSLNVWRDKPDVVSRGAQKNFADFASFIGGEWNKHSNDFNEVYYREAIAKAIVFKSVERLVTEQPWYQGGYRANVVAYAIAKLAHDVAQRGESINFERIWRAQGVSPVLRDAFVVSGEAVHDVIVNPPEGMRNVTEWAKQQACWHRVMNLDVAWPDALQTELVSAAERGEVKRAAVKDQKMLNGIEAQTVVVQAGSALWSNVKVWGMSKGLLSPDDQGILDVAISIPARVPSEKQSLRTIEILQRLREEGCQLEIEVS